MTGQSLVAVAGLDARARMSLGTSSDAIYEMVARVVVAHDIRGERVVDVGCGRGGLWPYVRRRFVRYAGVDAVRYDGLPPEIEFQAADLDGDRWPELPGGADLVAAVETIEHLENPWAFMRRLARLARPGGWVVVTTPNQLSLLSLATLVGKRRFSAFQDVHFPAHRTSLLESDLRRAVAEAGLDVVDVAFSLHGRVPLTPWHYPRRLSAACPRQLSDNLGVLARKAGTP